MDKLSILFKIVFFFRIVPAFHKSYNSIFTSILSSVITFLRVKRWGPPPYVHPYLALGPTTLMIRLQVGGYFRRVIKDYKPEFGCFAPNDLIELLVFVSFRKKTSYALRSIDIIIDFKVKIRVMMCWYRDDFRVRQEGSSCSFLGARRYYQC